MIDNLPLENTVLFHITPEMLEDFARLTGDYNSLHLDTQYARRTSHRQCIVHGLLPVSFLYVLLSSKNILPNFFIKKITANFLHAIYTEQKLKLAITQIQANPPNKNVEIQYTIKSQDTLQDLTTGLILLSEATNIIHDESCDPPQNDSFLLHPIKENTFQFNDIQTNQQEEISFCLHQSASISFREMISRGLENPSELASAMPVNNNLIASLMCSSLVGMRLPGRLATFVNLSLNFESNCIENQHHTLQGKVDFKSPSTQILIEKTSFHTHNNPYPWGHGKLTVKMESSSIENISIADIKESLLVSTLKDKVVLITGASRGIGAATAKMFSLSGAKVIVNYYRGKQDALAVVEDIQRNGGTARAIQADVTNRNEVKAMVKEAQDRFGTIHVLVNNAAHDFTAIPFLNLTWDQIQNDLDVILKGAFHCCQEIMPLMLNNKGGKIINVGTIATEYPPLAHTKYVAAKSALVGLTRSLAMEFAAYNIQINMVMPSLVETDLTKSIPLAIKEKIRHNIPMTRLANTMDVAGAIVMLAGHSTSFTTGQRFFVTGGESPLL